MHIEMDYYSYKMSAAPHLFQRGSRDHGALSAPNPP